MSHHLLYLERLFAKRSILCKSKSLRQNLRRTCAKKRMTDSSLSSEPQQPRSKQNRHRRLKIPFVFTFSFLGSDILLTSQTKFFSQTKNLSRKYSLTHNICVVRVGPLELFVTLVNDPPLLKGSAGYQARSHVAILLLSCLPPKIAQEPLV